MYERRGAGFVVRWREALQADLSLAADILGDKCAAALLFEVLDRQRLGGQAQRSGRRGRLAAEAAARTGFAFLSCGNPSVRAELSRAAAKGDTAYFPLALYWYGSRLTSNLQWTG